MRPYLIYAPHYTHRSAGVRALYGLADELTQRGCTATVFDWQSDDPPPVGTDAIVVYPEIVKGNPLAAERVVRWTLNKPGHLGGDSAYPDSEWVWTWSTDFYDAPLLSVETLDRTLFYIDDTPKTHDSFYVGKARYRGVTPYPLRGTVEITRRWPPTRDEVAAMLHSTRTLYTFDDCTALIDEARLCGCRVVLLPENRDLNPVIVSTQTHTQRLDSFVAATQGRWGSLKINLGCGKNILAGWENADLTGPVVVDLTTYPWPWKDDSADELLALHLVEHIPDFRGFMAECHRILAPGGHLTIETPHPLCEWFWQDPTHVHGYTTNTFRYYCTDAIYPSPDYGLVHFAKADVSEYSVPEAPGIPAGARVVRAVLTK